MSCNRENITWETKDGKWNIGFYAFHEVAPEDDEDFDYEWDVEYDNDTFWFVSTGHATSQQAMDAYCRQHSNPGGGWASSYKGNSKQNKEYDVILFAFQHPEEARKLQEKKARAEFRKEQAKLAAKIIADAQFWKSRRTVIYKKTVTRKGHSSVQHVIIKGYPKLVDDWQTIEGKRIFNEKTKKLSSVVISVEAANTTLNQSYRGYGRNW